MDARIVVVFAVGVVAACGPKPVTTQSAPPVVAAKEATPTPAQPEPTSSVNTQPTEPAAPKPCEAQVADVPTSLFGDRILIRPPVNVELVEDNPTLATTFSTFVSTCDATVDRMSLFVFGNDKAKSLSSYYDEFRDTLTKSGYSNGTDTTISESGLELMRAIEFPAADGNPPAKVLVAVSRKQDNVFVVFYQTQPDQWPGLSNTFVASARTLLVVPQ